MLERPLTLNQAVTRVKRWLDQPCTRSITSTERHWAVLRKLIIAALEELLTCVWK